jgi:glycosyltransferase involved in cell wall biosynthesis/O-antigen/teichoic acid export membrane protein
VADDERILLAMEETASTGVRVAGLRAANYAIGFVASVLIARALGPSGRGLYALPIAVLGIVMAFSHVGLEQSNVFLAAQKVPLRSLWTNAIVAAALISLVAWAAIAAVDAVAGPSFFGGLPTTWLVVTMAQIPFLLQALYWTGVLQLDGKLRGAVGATLAGTALHAAATVVLFAAGALTPFRVLALAWVANGATWALLLRMGSRSGLNGAPVDRALLRRAIGFGLRVQVATTFTFLLLRVDQLLVQQLLGFRELGLYSLAVILAELLWLVTDPFAASLLPHQVRAEGGDERRLGFATARLAIVVGLVGGLAAWVLAPYAIRIAYGEAFVDATWPFRLLLPGVVALAVQRPLGAIVVKEGRIGLAAAMNASALAVNVGLNLVLLPWIGVVGASVASAATYATLAAGYVLATRRPGIAGWRDLVPRRSDLGRLRGALRRRGPGDREPGPMRVVLVIGTLERGGTEGQVVMLARGLRRHGAEVTIVCLSSAGPLAEGLAAEGIAVEVAGFRGLTPILNPLPLLRVFRGLTETIRGRRPDVVHAFLYWGNLLGVTFGRRAEARVRVASLRSLRGTMGTKRALRPWERRTYRGADAVVCNSEAVREDAVRASGVPSGKTRVIRNGLALAEAAPPPTGGPARIAVVANLIAYKGHDVALRAFARVLERRGPDAAELLLAGTGPEEEHLRALAASLGISERVRLLGSVADVPALLEGCSFTVLPSRSEGFPNVVLESLAVGRAVVASAVGGVPEALEGGGGILVPPDDVEALAGAIDGLVADPAHARALGEEGRRAVAARFGEDRMVEETLGLYEELLSGLDARTRTGSSRSRAASAP